MTITDKRQNRIWHYILSFTLFSVMFIAGVFPAFADVGQVQGRFLYMIGQIRLFATYGAVISIAINGVILIVGSTNAGEKAKTGIIYTIIALAAMYMIPAFFTMGKGFFLSGWDPYNPGV